jgi:hypothetical protein
MHTGIAACGLTWMQQLACTLLPAAMFFVALIPKTKH